MATTTGGSTYVTSTDLVANYPTASLALANRVDLVASGEIVYNTGNYTITVADILGGKTIIQDSASATTVTLPSSSLVNGMQAKISNVGAGTVTVSGGTLLGTATINQYGGITAVYKTSITSWWLLPFSGSVGAANFTNTATGTYTGYKYVTFTGNGSLVIDRAGFADVLMIGGGGGGGSWANAAPGGGGAGSMSYITSAYFAAGTHTVTIGAGGAGGDGSNAAAGLIGTITALGKYYAPGGGGGAGAQGAGTTGYDGLYGGSGGGASAGTAAGTGGSSFSGLGNNGGNGFGSGTVSQRGGGGGGGAGAAGTAGSNSVGGNGGAGLANSITGASVTYCGGGGGGSGTLGTGGSGGGGNAVYGTGQAGTANTGGGGGGGRNGSGGAGGSGIVIVRVAV